MSLRYTYFDENHKKIGIITEGTTEEEKEYLRFLHDLDEIKMREE